MSEPAELIRVLYDPAAWADAAWFERYGADVRWPRRLANRMLLRHALISNLSFEACKSPRIKWLVENWEELPALVYLAGARLARDAIASRNGLLRLRWHAAHFVALPFFTPGGAAGSTLRPGWDEEDLDIHGFTMARGAECLLNAMRDTAPGWKERMMLRLPPLQQAHCDSDPAHSPENEGALLDKARRLQDAPRLLHSRPRQAAPAAGSGHSQPNMRMEQFASLQLLKFAASFHHAQKY